jgi:hypothetical protein
MESVKISNIDNNEKREASANFKGQKFSETGDSGIWEKYTKIKKSKKRWDM